LKIFGANYENSKDYAINLGYALQLTNIIRDFSEDYLMGRIYLPSDEINIFGLKSELLLVSAETEEFQLMMQFQADRADSYYKLADQSLNDADYKILKSARSMGKIYRNLLNLMRKDGFKVASKRYRVSTLKKMFIMLSS
jgi:phytoene synthase